MLTTLSNLVRLYLAVKGRSENLIWSHGPTLRFNLKYILWFYHLRRKCEGNGTFLGLGLNVQNNPHGLGRCTKKEK